MGTYNVRHKKTGNVVKVDEAFKEKLDKHGYPHVPNSRAKNGIVMGVAFDKDGNII